MGQACHWRHADFNERGCETFAHFEAEKYPLLETIAFFLTLHSPVTLCKVFRSPRLRNIQCRHGILFSDTDVPLDIIQWNGVPHFSLAFDQKSIPQTVLEALRRDKDLKSLVFCGKAIYRCLNPSPYGVYEESEVVSSNIETLSIQLGRADGFFNLLNYFISGLRLPMLSHLTITFLEPLHGAPPLEVFNIGSWPRETLSWFMQRSGCDLTTLALEGIPLTETEVVSIISATPSLHSFTLCESYAWWSHEVIQRRKH